MTNSEAIRQLNSLIDNSKSFIDGDSDDIWERDIEALNIAKVSLQEQAEREKGCEYCKDNYDLEIRKPYEAPSLYIDGNELIATRYDEADSVAEINYCPMCGRKLVEG